MTRYRHMLVLFLIEFLQFADYVIEATERIRGIKPIVLLSKRSPGDWAQSRKMHDDLICKLQMANVDDSLEQYIGPNMFW